MERLVWWMNRPVGRTARVLVGAALLAAGLLVGGPWGWLVALIGLVPLGAGASARCLLGPLFGSAMRVSAQP